VTGKRQNNLIKQIRAGPRKPLKRKFPFEYYLARIFIYLILPVSAFYSEDYYGDVDLKALKKLGF